MQYWNYMNFYKHYYKNLKNMWLEIKLQNKDIMTFCKNNKARITRVYNNHQLCDQLNIATVDTAHDYTTKDIQVYVYNL
jgi:phage host-nuclease inhibitor protein Gam